MDCATPGAFPWSVAVVAYSSPTLASAAGKKSTYCRTAETTAEASWKVRTVSPPGCDTSNKILPIMEYPHTVGIAVIGGYV
jgi:hypothetical protein